MIDNDFFCIAALIRDLIKKGPNNRIQGVYLTEYAPDYSVVLNLRNNTDTADERKEEIEEGEFFVRTPNNYGLVVVVQYLQLRLKYVGLSKESLQPMCRDYLLVSIVIIFMTFISLMS